MGHRRSAQIFEVSSAEVAVLVACITFVKNNIYAEVAQLVEHPPEERGVTSSILVLGTE